MAVAVTPSGQPSVRVATFGNANLSDVYYNRQGRRYEVNENLSLYNTFTLTASIYIPGSWIDNPVGSAGCETEANGCARTIIIDAEFGESTGGPGGTFRPTFLVRMGFDNKLSTAATQSYAAVNLRGALVEGNDTSGLTWPLSEKGTRLDFPFGWYRPSGWEGAVRRDDWNHFSLEGRLFNYDVAGTINGTTPVMRNCAETLRLMW